MMPHEVKDNDLVYWYKKAIEFHLDQEFIEMLHQEILSREIPVEVNSFAMMQA